MADAQALSGTAPSRLDAWAARIGVSRRTLVAGIVLPLWSVWKWRGGWRIAAALPAAAMGFVVLRILIGTAVDPTSHNLWPFEILQVGVVGLVVIGVLAVVRRVRGVRTP